MLARFDRFVRASSDWFANAGAVLLLAVFIISLIDVIGLKLFAWPVPGSTEFVGLFQAVFMALAVAMAQLMRQHISVGLVTDRLPKRAQTVIAIIVSLFLFVLFALLVWQTLLVGLNFQHKGQYSITARLPIHYFVYAMTIAFICPCLAFLLDFFKSVRELKSK